MRTGSGRARRFGLLLLAAFFARPAVGLAERMPFFDLPVCTGQARLIVRGHLDRAGKLTVRETYRGRVPGAAPLRLARGDEVFSALNGVDAQDGAIEVVAFLQEDGPR